MSMYEDIKKYINTLRTAYLGVDVRDGIANSIEAMNEKTRSLSERQDCLGSTFDSILGLEGHTDLEVVASRTNSKGTVYSSLKERLDSYDSIIDDPNINYTNSINYEMYGAKGDGITDDSEAIYNAHITANTLHLPVFADGSKKYYMKNTLKVPIKTHTNWNGCELIFDEDGDEKVANPFEILPSKDSIQVSDLSGITLTTSTTQIKQLAGNGMCLVDVVNANKKHYIRKGSNADNGYNQTEQFIIDNTGKILTPIYFSFDSITSITLYPLEKEVLYIGNASIRTKENTYNGDSSYIQRGILCKRNNTIIYGINHIVDESDVEGPAPSRGIIYFNTCSNVVVKDSFVSSRRQHNNIGTYEINYYKVVNATMENVIDKYILDTSRWGCHTSNYLKNLTVNNCQLSRVDAHKGVWGIKIKDSILGHQGIRLVGGGDLIVENVTNYAPNFISFRSDYGSSWRGKVKTKNVEHRPIASTEEVSVLRFQNDMTHDFGYNCYMPQTIEIEDYYLDDSNENSNDGLYKIINYVESFDSTVDYAYKVRFPREIKLRNIRNSSSKGFTVWSAAIAPFYASSDFSYVEKGENYSETSKNIIIKQNCIIEIDNVQLTTISTSSINSSSNNIFAIRGLGRQANDNYLTIKNRVVPHIIINNCKDACISLMGFPFILNVYRSTIKAANCVANGSRNISHFDGCIFDARFPDPSTYGYRFNGVTTDFVSCYFDKASYSSGNISKDTIANAYNFLSYNSVTALDSNLRSLCSFANCRIHPDIEPTTLFNALKNFRYEFNSSQGIKDRR